MQNDNIKNQNQQLPNQVAAVKFPFNPEAKSALSKERINEINQMCLRADIADRSFNGFTVDEGNLVIETCALEELFKELSYIGMNSEFYRHFNRAFVLLMQSEPNEAVNILNNYQSLSTLFRIVEKHNQHIHNKITETRVILDDLNTLDEESMKGGSSC